MLDLIWDAIEALFDCGGDAIDAVTDVASNVDLGDVFLIGSAIYVTNLTVSSIKDELRNRQDLKEKGVTQVIVKKFIEDNGRTVVYLDAINEQNKKVGTLPMKGRTCSGLYKGQKIGLYGC